MKGGRVTAEKVAWYQVKRGELKPPRDPGDFLKTRLREASLDDAVGLLTSRDLDSYIDLEQVGGNLKVRCIATVGLSNALRVGDPPGLLSSVGTINLLCQISVPFKDDALLEALALATEARTLAILESGVPSIQSGEPATGTGTDCIVIAAPAGEGGLAYSGKHTLAGHLIGKAVHEAIRQGAEAWKGGVALSKITVYQKPTCTTCKEVYAALKESGIDFEAVNYYLDPIPKEKLKELLRKMGRKASELLRKKEPIYKELELDKKPRSEEELVDLLVKYPDLIERPIVEKENRAILARPAERLKEIL